MKAIKAAGPLRTMAFIAIVVALAVVVLGGAAAVTIFDSWQNRVEAALPLFSTLAGGLLIVAATLFGVHATLSREDRRQRREQYEYLQLELLDRAHRWSTEVNRRVGRVVGYVMESGYAPDDVRKEDLLVKGEKEAEQFYQSGEQRLDEAAFLEKAIDDPEIARAVETLDGLLRGLNEALAGDDANPHVRIKDNDEAVQYLLEECHKFTDPTLTIERRHAEWVRERYRDV